MNLKTSAGVGRYDPEVTGLYQDKLQLLYFRLVQKTNLAKPEPSCRALDFKRGVGLTYDQVMTLQLTSYP